MIGIQHRRTPTNRLESQRMIDDTLKRVTEQLRVAIGNHQAQFARKIGIPHQTVYTWFRSGRISPYGAIAIERTMEDWPKERTRPDIVDWEGIKLRKPQGGGSI